MARTIPIQKLIAAIEHTEDDNVIVDLYHRLGLTIEKNITYNMSEPELKGVNEGIEQIKKGASSSHEEVVKKAGKWLKK